MAKKYCMINMYVDTLDKILHLLQNYVETLNNYDDIEEIINIIHFLQEQMYYADKKEGVLGGQQERIFNNEDKEEGVFSDIRKNES